MVADMALMSFHSLIGRFSRKPRLACRPMLWLRNLNLRAFVVQWPLSGSNPSLSASRRRLVFVPSTLNSSIFNTNLFNDDYDIIVPRPSGSFPQNI